MHKLSSPWLCLAILLAGLLQPGPRVLAQPPAAGQEEQSAEQAADPAEAESLADSPPAAGSNGRSLKLEEFRPRSMLKVEEHHLKRAKFPVVDAHVHPRVRLHHSPELLDATVKVMDQQNIAVAVSLDGQMGDAFIEHKNYLWTKYPDRFVIFVNVDWRGDGKERDAASWDCQREDFARRTAKSLAECKKLGASGLKVFKDLGLVYRNPDGSLIRVDDPRWDPIWHACGELGLPVLIHTADPAAFFLPVDAKNERWEELRRHPEWSFSGPGFPQRDELLKQFENIVRRHPKTNFIGAHVASNAENLGAVGALLDRYPNLYVDIAARIGELGRQPFTARKFFIKYADRILFGTDGPRAPQRLVLHWRFLETFDEYFPYAENAFPPQGFWRIYGVGLPDDVLKKIYHENAERLIPGVKERMRKRLGDE